MEKQEVLGHVAKVVRALITSAKPPVELRSIVKDYMDVEGEPIPFHRLGYSNEQELLRATNQFKFHHYGNQSTDAAALMLLLLLLFAATATGDMENLLPSPGVTQSGCKTGIKATKTAAAAAQRASHPYTEVVA
ncbi:GD11508 [Drosophila simulans]|uniref:GD11508 n=1 Tax=Drosophila simulans TaxID=7240 RepID=B4QEM9_DROSI|nr:GD11508 [Drosophila simulans]